MDWADPVAWAWAAPALLLLGVDLALSVALVALTSLSHVALRRMASEEPQLLFLEEMQQPASRYRTAAELGRQLSLVGAILLLTAAARAAGSSHPPLAGALLAVAIGVLLLEAFAARLLALHNPRLALRMTAGVVRAVRWLLFPLAAPIAALLQHRDAQRPMNGDERDEEEEDVEALIEVGEREGLLEAEEGEMLRGIVDLDETRVREIMTPRTDIVALAEDTPVAEARRTFLDAGHSRIPVYRGSIDTVVGVLHSRDLFRAWEDAQDQQAVSGYLRSAEFVPESSSARAVLAKMRQSNHLALVVDEYGGIAGLVTLEDLLEEIVGDIRDEHDDEEEWIVEESEGVWLVAAAAHIKELETLVGMDFADREFDTVGGLVVFGFGHVPTVGEVLDIQGLRIEVVQSDRRRVHRVRIRRNPSQEAEIGETAP